jgi:hypothetical protein
VNKHKEIINEIKTTGVNEGLLAELRELCSDGYSGSCYALILNDQTIDFEEKYNSLDKLCSKKMNGPCLSLYDLLVDRVNKEGRHNLSPRLRKKVFHQSDRFEGMCASGKELECIYTKSLRFIMTKS